MPQTKTVELDAALLKRAQREADKRGITLKQLVDGALERKLADEEQVPPGKVGEPADPEMERRRLAANRLLGLFADVGSGRSLVDEVIAGRRVEAKASDH
jgi:hypothetical protein